MRAHGDSIVTLLLQRNRPCQVRLTSATAVSFAGCNAIQLWTIGGSGFQFLNRSSIHDEILYKRRASLVCGTWRMETPNDLKSLGLCGVFLSQSSSTLTVPDFSQPNRPTSVVVVQYLTRRYGFTVVCIRTADGRYEATLTRRSPGLAQPMECSRPPETMMLADDERFSSVNRAAAVEACRSRIVELDGEILSEIATGEDDEEANTSASASPTRR